jgi:tetratricopeptide (TPR) repeat protein
MPAKIPTVRQIAWISLIPQMLVLGTLIAIFYFLNIREPLMAGAATYLTISFGLRTFIPKYHRKGISFVKQKQFEKAIPYFEKSVDYFTRYSWIDKYRYLTLLTSSAITFKEMAWCNIAFCYSQLGEGRKAIEYYKIVLREYPESALANTGLAMLHSMIQSPPKTEQEE